MSPSHRPASVLDGFFTDDKVAIVAALHALDDITQPDHSYGRVGRSEPWKVDGLFSERIFGPLTSTRTPGGDPSTRLWRFAHVEIPPTPHPRCNDVVVERVPLPPPGDRPLVAPLTPAQKLDWIGPVNELWGNLIRRANRIARMKQIGAPQITIDFELTRIERDLRLVVDATNDPPLPDARAWWTPSPPEPIVVGRPPAIFVGSDDTRAHLLFLDDETLLLQRNDQRDVLAIGLDGTIRFRFASPMRALRSVHGRRIVFHGWLADPMMFEADDASVRGPDTPFCIYDVDAARFLERWPDDIACVVAHFGEDNDLALHDEKTGDWMPLALAGAPIGVLVARDGRFVWAFGEHGGLVVDAATGIPQCAAPAVPDAIAFALTSEHEWCFVDGDGGTGTGAQLGPIEAGAFSPEGDRFAFVRDDVIYIVDDAFDEVGTFRIPR